MSSLERPLEADGDILGLLGVEVFGADFDDTVDVNAEGDFDSWLSTSCWFDARKLEVAE